MVLRLLVAAALAWTALAAPALAQPRLQTQQSRDAVTRGLTAQFAAALVRERRAADDREVQLIDAAETRMREARRQWESATTDQAQAEATLLACREAYVRLVESATLHEAAARIQVEAFRAEISGGVFEATPELLAAYQQFADGDRQTAWTTLETLLEIRREARRTASRVVAAAELRQIASLREIMLANGEATTAQVLALFEQVVALDANEFEDWVRLSDLYNDVANPEAARNAVNRAVALADDEREHIMAVFVHAAQLERERDWSSARTAYERYLDLCRAAARAHPSESEWQRDIATGLGFVAQLMLMNGDVDGARARYEEALQTRRALFAADETDLLAASDVASSLRRLGDHKLEEGDVAGARVTYAEAVEITRRLVAHEPASVEWREDLSSSLGSLGTALLHAADIPGARAAFDESLSLRRRLAEQDSTSTSAQRNAAMALFRAARVIGPHDWATARSYYDESLGILRALIDGHASLDNTYSMLAIVEMGLGDQLADQGQRIEARSHYEIAIVTMRTQLQTNPDDLGARQMLSLVLSEFGKLVLSDADADAAISAFDESLALLREVVANDPQGERLRRGSVLISGDVAKLLPTIAASTMLDQADALREHGESAAAMARYRPALEELRGLVSRYPRSYEVRDAFADALVAIADAQVAQRDFDAARQHYLLSITFRRQLATENSGSVYQARSIASIQNKLGDLSRAQHRLPEALLQYREALASYRSLAAERPDDTSVTFAIAATLSDIGDALHENGNSLRAQATLEEVVRIGQSLIEQDSILGHALLADTYDALGRFSLADDPAAATRFFEQSIAAQRTIGALLPSDRNAESSLADTLEGLAGAHTARGDRDAARESSAEALALRQRLAEQYPNDASAQREVWVSMFSLQPLGGTDWRSIVVFMESLDRRGLLEADDRQWLERARTSAALEGVH